MLAAALAGCGGSEHIPLDREQDRDQITPELRSACQLAERRCSHCHSLDRILVARVSRPEQWSRYVERMRRMPSSGIARHESPIIVRCLVYWSFGASGLEVLDAEGEEP